MKTHTYLWQPEGTTISPLTSKVIETVIAISEELPYLVWPEKSEKLLSTSGISACKERKLQKVEVLQSLSNVWLRQALQEAGFEAECPVRNDADIQRVDFSISVEEGKRSMTEVEFGNTSSIDRNLVKLTEAYNHGRSVFGIMVLPIHALACNIATSGIATFESAVARLKPSHPDTFKGPILLIGLDHRGAPRIDLSESQLPDASCLSGNGNKAVLWHVASELRAGVCVKDIGLPTASQEREARNQLKRQLRITDGQGQLFC